MHSNRAVTCAPENKAEPSSIRSRDGEDDHPTYTRYILFSSLTTVKVFTSSAAAAAADDEIVPLHWQCMCSSCAWAMFSLRFSEAVKDCC